MTIKMKKLVLGTIIGAAFIATISPNLNAATVNHVYSDITNIQLWRGQSNLMAEEAPGYFTDLQFGGTATDVNDDGLIDNADIMFTGLIGFTTNSLPIQLTFNLSNGSYAQGSGITFSGGYIQIEVQTTEGWIPYSAIDASITNIGFLANQPGALADAFPGQTTAGIIRNALPGSWDGEIGSAGFNRAAGSFTLLAQSLTFYMQGEIGTGFPDEGVSGMLFGPPEVPVPGAAWLFGSALVGLAGVRRRRG
jgi:hypothetical protein